jgi:uncharacterized membrane protein
MRLARITRHLLSHRRQVSRLFPGPTLRAIEQAIQASEGLHAGEIRFVVEAGLDGGPLLAGQTARQRAIELFSQLRVWDTDERSGLLIYVLLADRAVEIVADRGIDARVGLAAWRSICRAMEAAFRQGHFAAGVMEGVQAVTRLLVEHFPVRAHPRRNELPDAPVLL